MAKKKSTGRSREKTLPPGERCSRAIEWLKKRVVQVEELRREGDPYRDASRTRVEIQIRETLRTIFGEHSEEFQHLQNFRIPSTTERDIDHALVFLHELILFLEHRRLQAIGIVSTRLDSPLFVPPSDEPPHATVPRPTPPITPTPSAHTSSPASSHRQPDAGGFINAGPASSPSKGAGRPPWEGDMESVVHDMMARNRDVTPTPSPPPLQPHGGGTPSLGLTPQDYLLTILQQVTKIGNRFHVVAQQLKLRGDVRPTVEMQDHRDVQDLFGSLLRIEFDEISTEVWIPGEGSTGDRSMLLLGRGQVGLLLKKTRMGWGEKEFCAEVRNDHARLSSHPTCRAVFYFVYDPEGRIENPKDLESRLSRTSRHPFLQILIAPH